ncbi:MAG: hypothetical protein NC131_11225 [Roseburia sp.]|nr:hypothetical protein [Roseburia sp.]
MTLTESAYEALKNTFDAYKKRYKNIKFNDDYEKFDLYFNEEYDLFRKKYMIRGDEELDRHKVAALIIVAAMRSQLISCEGKVKSGYFNLQSENIIVDVAFAWIKNELNLLIMKKDPSKKVMKLIMPEAFACDTSYYNIFCRSLHYSYHENLLNVLELAEKLFLIEYIAVRENKIPISYLKEKR